MGTFQAMRRPSADRSMNVHTADGGRGVDGDAMGREKKDGRGHEEGWGGGKPRRLWWNGRSVAGGTQYGTDATASGVDCLMGAPKNRAATGSRCVGGPSLIIGNE